MTVGLHISLSIRDMQTYSHGTRLFTSPQGVVKGSSVGPWELRDRAEWLEWVNGPVNEREGERVMGGISNQVISDFPRIIDHQPPWKGIRFAFTKVGQLLLQFNVVSSPLCFFYICLSVSREIGSWVTPTPIKKSQIVTYCIGWCNWIKFMVICTGATLCPSPAGTFWTHTHTISALAIA